MRKGISHKKLSRTTNARKQLLRVMMHGMVNQGFINTTLGKAKFAEPSIEKLVTLAKKTKLTNLRQLIKITGNYDTALKYAEYGKLFIKRKGGYTRIIRLGERAGDAAPYVKLEWVEKLAIKPKPKIEATKKLEKKVEVKKITGKKIENKDKSIKK